MAACAAVRPLFLLAGFADLDETVELVVLLVDAVGDPRFVLLARGGRGLLDELADIVLEDRDAVVECVDGKGVFVVIAHDAFPANQSGAVGWAKRSVPTMIWRKERWWARR